MPLRAHLSGYRQLGGIHGSAWRMGIYAGVCLSFILTAWLIVANRVPVLDHFAWERNLAAVAALALFAALPILRFVRSPGRLLFSGLLAWTIFSLVYRGHCLYFSALASRMGAFHLFMLGSVLYLFGAALAWIGTLIWSVRNHHAHDSAHRLG